MKLRIAFLFTLCCAVALAADRRIKDIVNTATEPAADDYLAIDGATNGTRKILGLNLRPVTLSGSNTFLSGASVTFAAGSNLTVNGAFNGTPTGGTLNLANLTLTLGTQSADIITDGTTNKAYTAAEKTKLAGIATGATANDTDANLRARSSHTGTQSADTITDGTTNKAYTATEKTKLAGIEAGAQVNRAIASQAEAEAGSANDKDMTPLRVAQAIAALAPGGGDISSTGTNTFLSGATVTFNAGSTLTINGTLSGTPTGGTLNLSNVTVSFGTVNVGTLVPSAITWGSNIVPAANGGAGTINGILKGNGSGTTSQAVSGTDYEPARTTVTQVAAEAGTSTTVYNWTPERVGQAIAALAPGGSASIPTGIIAMWSGALADIPSGWQLADGTNGTPDLRSRFIYGAAAGVEPGLTGGSTTFTPTGTITGTAVADHPSHTHTYSEVLQHTHTVTVTDPGHTHVQAVNSATTGGLSGYTPDTSSNTTSTSGYSTASATTGITASTSNPAGSVATGTTNGPSATLTHSVTQGTFTGNSGTSLPPYYTLAFICKMGGTVANVTFTPSAGEVASGTTITLASATSGATIRYTTGDGSQAAPTRTTGTVYSTPVSITSAQTLKAIAYRNNYVDSAVTSSAYTIGSSYIAATGGTITTDGNYKVHTFTSSGTFQITSGSGNVEYLVVGGGGGGGGGPDADFGGGGGGAGGMRTGTKTAMSSGSYTVTVGNGGNGGASQNDGSDGGNSVFDDITSTGGGGGAGLYANAGRSGGSGGGASGGGAVTSPGTGTSGQGSDGGNGNSPNQSGGGGGGKGAVGSAGGSAGGDGGAGTSSSITGAAVTYAGGGGGGGGFGGGGSGGSGGGGGGGFGSSSGSAGSNGTANTGGGGGGGGDLNAGGNGGSGVVIVRYQFQ